MAEETWPVKSMDEYRLLIKNQLRGKPVDLSFNQALQLDILRQLIALNQKMTFFVVLTVIALIITVVNSCSAFLAGH